GGSSQVGASERWTAQLSCPCGLAAGAAVELAAIATAAMAAMRCRRSHAVRWPKPLGSAGTAPAWVLAMAFPFKRRTEMQDFCLFHPPSTAKGGPLTPCVTDLCLLPETTVTAPDCDSLLHSGGLAQGQTRANGLPPS